MSKQQITAHVFMAMGWNDDYTRQEWAPEVWKCRVADEEKRIYIGAQTVTINVPDDFDPTAKVVAALEAEKRRALDAYQKAVADINERMSKYLAITNEVEA